MFRKAFDASGKRLAWSMMPYMRHIILLFTLAVSSTLAVADGFDWDDNIMVMPSKIWVRQKDEPTKMRGVTTADWAIMRDDLGKNGDWKNWELWGDSKTGAKREMGDGQGSDTFKKAVLAALEEKNDKWQGPAWKKFVEACATREGAAKTVIVTGRAHDPSSIYEGLRALQSARPGVLKFLPPVENIYPVANPKVTPGLEGTAKSPAEAKSRIIRGLLDTLDKAPGGPHRWDFSDDDYRNISTLEKDLEASLKAGSWPNVRITLTYTGSNHPTERARTITLPSTPAPLTRKSAGTPGH